MTAPSKPVRIQRRDGITRRDALRGLAAAMAAIQTVGCYEQPSGVVEAQDARPENAPDGATSYATALTLDGFATGVIASCHRGWPTKLDGNPAHPAARGGSTPILQARVLDLYDPQRLRGAEGDLARLAAPSAKPLWLVMPPSTSPTVARLLAAIAARRELHVIWDEPLSHAAAYAGTKLAFGRELEVQVDPAAARVIAALDADWLAAMPMSPAWARAMAAGRAPGPTMSRLWAAEPMPTPTGTLADERLPTRAGDVVAIAAVVAAELGLALPDGGAAARARAGQIGAPWAKRLAADLRAHRGAGAVVVGDRQPAAVHALARWIDRACGNDRGGPVRFTAPARIAAPGAAAGYADLVAARRAGEVDVVVLDANPVATAPRALGLADALRHATVVSAWPDETAALAGSRLALAHELEAWGDARAWDGTPSVQQPVVRPRFAVVSPVEVLAALAGEPHGAQAIVRETWTAAGLAGDEAWRRALATGLAGPPADAIDAPALDDGAVIAAVTAAIAALAPPSPYELALAPSRLHDGRFAGNGWLQELPHPVTKQMWGNAALLAPVTALGLGVADGDALEVSTPAGTVVLPARLVPGHAADAVTVELGYGRRVPGLPIADRVGGDGFALRTGDALVGAAKLRAAGGTRALSVAQLELTQHGRPIAPSTTVATLRAHPDLARDWRGPTESLMPEREEVGLQWAMSIDTSLCTGCSACVVACVAENNTPVVGPEEAARGHRMHWLRIDSYVEGAADYVHQAVPCMHCEHAPCEYVCPVGATMHSPDGLNEQVYNRCVGTRFCSNNCPYKVRRFNWFAYESPSLQHNPDVTVRSRGVMEKCTYCVQRIRGAEHDALVEHREIRPGEVVTACQAACPTTAIEFGAKSHPGPLAVRRGDPRRYELLHHLGTRPRTQHLLRVRNPAGEGGEGS